MLTTTSISHMRQGAAAVCGLIAVTTAGPVAAMTSAAAVAMGGPSTIQWIDLARAVPPSPTPDVSTFPADLESGRHAGHTPLGAPVEAPRAFLDFCRRQPAECLDGEAQPAQLHAVRARAAALFWAQVLDRPAQEGGGQGGAQPVAVASTRFDWSRVFPAQPSRVPARPGLMAAEDAALAAAETPGARARFAPPVRDAEAAPAAADFGRDAAARGVAGPAPATTIASLDKAAWRRVNQINRRLNREIRRASDEQLYGRDEYWAAPSGPGAQGDCEDYVLAKRRELIRDGVPAGALSIAVVDTPKGERHAVLLIATDDGEYVLDNLTPWISRWDKVGYQWRWRQAPGRVFDWVRMDA